MNNLCFKTMKTKHIILAFSAAHGRYGPYPASAGRPQIAVSFSRPCVAWNTKSGPVLNIGGATPLALAPGNPCPDGLFSPILTWRLRGNIIKWLGKEEKWGFIIGLRLETKGMEAEARTKN